MVGQRPWDMTDPIKVSEKDLLEPLGDGVSMGMCDATITIGCGEGEELL
jgi:hypothetical protein